MPYIGNTFFTDEEYAALQAEGMAPEPAPPPPPQEQTPAQALADPAPAPAPIQANSALGYDSEPAPVEEAPPPPAPAEQTPAQALADPAPAPAAEEPARPLGGLLPESTDAVFNAIGSGVRGAGDAAAPYLPEGVRGAGDKLVGAAQTAESILGYTPAPQANADDPAVVRARREAEARGNEVVEDVPGPGVLAETGLRMAGDAIGNAASDPGAALGSVKTGIGNAVSRLITDPGGTVSDIGGELGSIGGEVLSYPQNLAGQNQVRQATRPDGTAATEFGQRGTVGVVVDPILEAIGIDSTSDAWVNSPFYGEWQSDPELRSRVERAQREGYTKKDGTYVMPGDRAGYEAFFDELGFGQQLGTSAVDDPTILPTIAAGLLRGAVRGVPIVGRPLSGLAGAAETILDTAGSGGLNVVGTAALRGAQRAGRATPLGQLSEAQQISDLADEASAASEQLLTDLRTGGRAGTPPVTVPGAAAPRPPAGAVTIQPPGGLPVEGNRSIPWQQPGQVPTTAYPNADAVPIGQITGSTRPRFYVGADARLDIRMATDGRTWIVAENLENGREWQFVRFDPARRQARTLPPNTFVSNDPETDAVRFAQQKYFEWQNTTPGGTTFRLAPQFEGLNQQTVQTLENTARRRLDDLGLGDVGLRIVRQLTELDPAAPQNAVASFSRGRWLVGLASGGSLDEAANSVNHEAVHALRTAGALREQEWRALSNLAATKQAADGRTYLDNARGLYSTLDNLSEDGVIEEAVAEMFRDYVANPRLFTGETRSILEKLKQVLTRVREVFGGTPDGIEVLRRIDQGDVGARRGANPMAPDMAAAADPESQRYMLRGMNEPTGEKASTLTYAEMSLYTPVELRIPRVVMPDGREIKHQYDAPRTAPDLTWKQIADQNKTASPEELATRVKMAATGISGPDQAALPQWAAGISPVGKTTEQYMDELIAASFEEAQRRVTEQLSSQSKARGKMLKTALSAVNDPGGTSRGEMQRIYELHGGLNAFNAPLMERARALPQDVLDRIKKQADENAEILKTEEAKKQELWLPNEKDLLVREVMIQDAMEGRLQWLALGYKIPDSLVESGAMTGTKMSYEDAAAVVDAPVDFAPPTWLLFDRAMNLTGDQMRYWYGISGQEIFRRGGFRSLDEFAAFLGQLAADSYSTEPINNGIRAFAGTAEHIQKRPAMTTASQWKSNMAAYYQGLTSQKFNSFADNIGNEAGIANSRAVPYRNADGSANEDVIGLMTSDVQVARTWGLRDNQTLSNRPTLFWLMHTQTALLADALNAGVKADTEELFTPAMLQAYEWGVGRGDINPAKYAEPDHYGFMMDVVQQKVRELGTRYPSLLEHLDGDTFKPSIWTDPNLPRIWDTNDRLMETATSTMEVIAGKVQVPEIEPVLNARKTILSLLSNVQDMDPADQQFLRAAQRDLAQIELATIKKVVPFATAFMDAIFGRKLGYPGIDKEQGFGFWEGVLSRNFRLPLGGNADQIGRILTDLDIGLYNHLFGIEALKQDASAVSRYLPWDGAPDEAPASIVLLGSDLTAVPDVGMRQPAYIASEVDVDRFAKLLSEAMRRMRGTSPSNPEDYSLSIGQPRNSMTLLEINPFRDGDWDPAPLSVVEQVARDIFGDRAGFSAAPHDYQSWFSMPEYANLNGLELAGGDEVIARWQEAAAAKRIVPAGEEYRYGKRAQADLADAPVGGTGRNPKRPLPDIDSLRGIAQRASNAASPMVEAASGWELRNRSKLEELSQRYNSQYRLLGTDGMGSAAGRDSSAYPPGQADELGGVDYRLRPNARRYPNTPANQRQGRAGQVMQFPRRTPAGGVPRSSLTTRRGPTNPVSPPRRTPAGVYSDPFEMAVGVHLPDDVRRGLATVIQVKGVPRSIGDVAMDYQQQIDRLRELSVTPNAAWSPSDGAMARRLKDSFNDLEIDFATMTDAQADKLAARLVSRDVKISEGALSPTGKPIAPKGPMGKAMAGLDSYMTLRRNMTLYSTFTGPSYIMMQGVGNAIGTGLYRPTALNDYFKFWEWGKIRRYADDPFNAAALPSVIKARQRFGLTGGANLVDTYHASLGNGTWFSQPGRGPIAQAVGKVVAPQWIKRFANGMDTTHRFALYWDAFDPAIAEARKMLPDHARTTLARMSRDGGGIVPITPRAVERALKDLSKREKGQFDGKMVRDAIFQAGGAENSPNRQALWKYADRMGRDWTETVRKVDKAAQQVVDEGAFPFKETNLDAVLSKTFMFHYWMSRASVLYVETAMKNPWQLKTWIAGMEAANERREEDGVPTWKSTFVDLMGTPAGYILSFNPVALLSTYFFFGEVGGDHSIRQLTGVGRFFEEDIGANLMLNPLLHAALYTTGLMGKDASVPDVIGSRKLEREISNGIQLANGLVDGWFKSQQIDGERFPMVTDAIDSRYLLNRAAEYLSGIVPGSQEVAPFNPNGGNRDQMIYLIAEEIKRMNPLMAARLGSPDEETAKAAAAELETAVHEALNDPSSEAYQAARESLSIAPSLGPWAEKGGLPAIAGSLVRRISPFTFIAAPEGKVEAQKRAALDRKTVEDAAINNLRYAGSEENWQLGAAMDRYFGGDVWVEALLRIEEPGLSGAELFARGKEIRSDESNPINRRARELAAIDDRYYGIVGGKIEGTLTLSTGESIDQAALAGLTPEQRYDWADAWLADQGVGREFGAWRAAKEELLTANPDLAGYEGFKDIAESYPGGVDLWIADTMKVNPGYKQYVDGVLTSGEAMWGTPGFHDLVLKTRAYKAGEGMRSSPWEIAPKGNGRYAGLPENQSLASWYHETNDKAGAGYDDKDLSSLERDLAYMDEAIRVADQWGVTATLVNQVITGDKATYKLPYDAYKAITAATKIPSGEYSDIAAYLAWTQQNPGLDDLSPRAFLEAGGASQATKEREDALPTDPASDNPGGLTVSRITGREMSNRTKDQPLTVNRTVVNLRSDPGMEGEVLTMLRFGEPVRAVGEKVTVGDQTWVMLQTEDGRWSGWMNAAYLSLAA